ALPGPWLYSLASPLRRSPPALRPAVHVLRLLLPTPGDRLRPPDERLARLFRLASRSASRTGAERLHARPRLPAGRRPRLSTGRRPRLAISHPTGPLSDPAGRIPRLGQSPTSTGR